MKIRLIIAVTIFVLGTQGFAQSAAPTAQKQKAPSSDVWVTEGPRSLSVAAGPAFATGLKSGKMMFDVTASLNHKFSGYTLGKIFADAALGSGVESARFLNAGIGADFYPVEMGRKGAAPYLSGDIGYAESRNIDEKEQRGVALGIGAGYRFASGPSLWDASIHWTTLTEQNADETPMILAIRAGMTF